MYPSDVRFVRQRKQFTMKMFLIHFNVLWSGKARVANCWDLRHPRPVEMGCTDATCPLPWDSEEWVVAWYSSKTYIRLPRWRTTHRIHGTCPESRLCINFSMVLNSTKTPKARITGFSQGDGRAPWTCEKLINAGLFWTAIFHKSAYL